MLGRLVEIWSGKPFEVFLDERIFRPLRMTDTMFWAATPDQRARLTTVYGPAPGGGLMPVETETLPFTERPTLIEGAVGLLSTVPDYLRFSQMLLNKGELDGVRLLSAETVETMTANGLSDAVQKARGGSMGWGLGERRRSCSNPAPRSGDGRIRVGRHGRHHLLDRSEQGDRDPADDPEPAVKPRSDPAAVQGHRPAGSRRLRRPVNLRADGTLRCAESRPRSPAAGARSPAAPHRFLSWASHRYLLRRMISFWSAWNAGPTSAAVAAK